MIEITLNRRYKIRYLRNLALWTLCFYLLLNACHPSSGQKTDLPQVEFLGQWGYESNEYLCDRIEVRQLFPNCDRDTQLLEINAYHPFLDVIALLSDVNYARFLFSKKIPKIDPNTAIEIFSENSCSSIFIDPRKLLYSNNLDYILLPEDIDCKTSRSIYINNFNLSFAQNIDSKDITRVKSYLETLNIIKDNNLEIHLLNSHSLRIYSNSLRKNIILNNNYWEQIIIVLIVDSKTNQATIILEGQFGTGINPPANTSLLSANATFPTEVKQFVDKFQAELIP